MTNKKNSKDRHRYPLTGIRFKPEFKEAIQQNAEESGVSMTDFIAAATLHFMDMPEHERISRFQRV